MEYTVIIIAVLLLSPFILKIATSQNKKTKYNLRIILLVLLGLQLLAGFLNWEVLKGFGRSGFELSLTFPSSYLWLFFAISFIQFLLLVIKKPALDITSVILNFINTAIFFAGMIMLSNLLGRQVVSFASISTIFAVLIGNVAGLMLINKDNNLFKKYS